MSRVLLLALIVALLPACATEQRAEGGVDIVWMRVDDTQAACQGLSGRREIFRVLGCSKWNDSARADGTRVCTIYAPAPRSELDTQRFATLGHELMHCFDGQWHDRWGRMNPPDERQAATGGSAASTPRSGAAAN